MRPTRIVISGHWSLVLDWSLTLGHWSFPKPLTLTLSVRVQGRGDTRNGDRARCQVHGDAAVSEDAKTLGASRKAPLAARTLGGSIPRAPWPRFFTPAPTPSPRPASS